MPDASDDMFLSSVQLCDLAGIKRPRRAAWADQEIVRKAPARGKYGETDAVELVVFVELVRQLDFDDAMMAWKDVQVCVRKTALRDAPMLVLVDLRAKRGELLDDLAAIGRAIRPRHPTILLDMSQIVAEVRDTCRRMRAVAGGKNRPDDD